VSARRAARRWLDGDCPAGVLAIFDNGGETFDRFTVLYVPDAADPDTVQYLGASAHPFDPQGFGQHGEMPRHQAAAYRYRETSAKHSARWSDLPADVQRAVRADLTTGD
jgi:hypothetical protein